MKNNVFENWKENKKKMNMFKICIKGWNFNLLWLEETEDIKCKWTKLVKKDHVSYDSTHMKGPEQANLVR